MKSRERRVVRWHWTTPLSPRLACVAMPPLANAAAQQKIKSKRKITSKKVGKDPAGRRWACWVLRARERASPKAVLRYRCHRIPKALRAAILGRWCADGDSHL